MQAKTGYREIIVNLLNNHKKPLSVPDMLELLATQKLKPNKTTLYRALEVLVNEKAVIEVNFGDNTIRYESASLAHHHHLVCTKCHHIEDVVLENDLESIEKQISHDKKFTITDHSLEFFGLCAKCA